jgi:peptide/nickel transport system permease protein
MRRALLRKALAVAPLLLAASALVFALMRMLPGDPALSIFAGSTHELSTREALRQELGLDQPLAIQYVRWLGSMVRGELGGRSVETREPIGSLVARQGSVTLLVTAYAMLLSVLVAGPLGIAAAVWKGRWPDGLIRALTLGGSSVPMVLLAFAAIVVLLRVFRWSPPVVYAGPFVDPGTHAQMMLAPALLLAWEYGSHLVRITRAAMIEALASEPVLAARARGVPRKVIVLRHAFRLALVPATASIGIQFGALVGGVMVVETVFGLPGLGRGVVKAALARDYPVVQCIVTLLVLLGLLVDLAMEAVHPAIDPRVTDES